MVLEVQLVEREIYVLGDGAKWIRNWYRELSVVRKSMTLCWYHLGATVHDLSSMSFGRELGHRVKKGVLNQLWRGNVEGALKEIERVREEVVSSVSPVGSSDRKEALRKLVKYLNARRPYIVNYEQFYKEGKWIANTRVEKFNDFAVAARCKHEGRSWSYEGAMARAALETAGRNGELDIWWEKGELPRWEDTGVRSAQPIEFVDLSRNELNALWF